MKESKKIQRELQNFWLRQLDQRKESGDHREKMISSPELLADPLLQRQLQRLQAQRAGRPTANGSTTESIPVTANQKKPGVQPAAALEFAESNHHGSAADALHQCLAHDFGPEPFEGQFYVKAVDVLSLQRAEHEWNGSAGERAASPQLSGEWENIDDRLRWLGAPSL